MHALKLEIQYSHLEFGTCCMKQSNAVVRLCISICECTARPGEVIVIICFSLLASECDQNIQYCKSKSKYQAM